MFLSSCKRDNQSVENIKEEYFYKISYKDSSRVDYTYRQYEFIGDSIKLKAKRFNSMGESISNNGNGGLFLIDENQNIKLLGKSMRNPDSESVVFSVKERDSCWTYFHPYYHQMRNCYKGSTADGSELIFTSEQLADDGISRVLYLDKRYILIKETSDSPLEKFRDMVRVDKSEIPKRVLDSIY